MTKVNQALGWLKAAAEPTRLRLLALCAQRDFSVSDLARLLGQSEPRVSRHLKVLCEAGLLDRVRQGQWVHYRLDRGDGASVFVQGLLAQLDRTDDTLMQDR
ncbi:MAG: ArsR/SmtB family transcription factor, partial [Steroidobacteraceae bacterium]